MVRTLIVTLVLVGLSGCVAPMEFVNESVSLAARESADPSGEVHRAIRRAAVRLGYRVIDEADGQLLLMLQKGRHYAKIRVQHDGQNYSLLADDYSVKTRKYNQWISNLRKKVAIELELINDVGR